MGTVLSNVTCEVTMEVTMKNTVLWELTPCDEEEIHYHFRSKEVSLVNFYQTSLHYNPQDHSLFYHEYSLIHGFSNCGMHTTTAMPPTTIALYVT